VKLALILSTIASASIAHPVSAQTRPAAEPLGGSAIAGICLLSREAVLTNAKIGKAATARLQQLAQQAQAEVAAGRKPIQDDWAALQAQRATLKPADLAQRQQALAQRDQAIAQTAQQRSRELELTRQKAMTQIADDAQPVIATAYKARNCGLLVSRDVVLGGNMTGDLTADVVKGLDSRITTISFDRATLPAQVPGGAH